MRNLVQFSIVASALTLSGTAFAQSAPKAQSGVDSYLCTFAGKCGDTAASEEVKAAPATKGFSLARTRQQTVPAPETKGFSLARPKPQTAPAPDTKGFSLARPKQAAPAPDTKGFALARPSGSTTRPVRPRVATPARVRPARAVATSPKSATGKAITTGARADLMLSFELNSAEMTGAARDRAKVFAQALNTPELRGHRFLIEGHTDSAGGRSPNVELSRRRAQSVADYLIAQGVERSRLEVRGFGYDRPLPGKSARSQDNRRVEAALIS